MKLPNEVSQKLEIDPGAEYDALFMMPPRMLARVFYILSLYKTKTVTISINNQSVRFAKEGGNGNVVLDRGDDSDTSDDDTNEAVMVLDLVQLIVDMDAAVEVSLCMMCLHNYINTITKDFPRANQMTMYMGRDLPTVIVYRVPGIDFMGYKPPPANHMYHRKQERAQVRNQGIMDLNSDNETESDSEDEGVLLSFSEDGGEDEEEEEENETDSEDGDEDEQEDGDEDEQEDGDEDEMDSEDEDEEEDDTVVVINRKRVWSQMMDEDEMDPQDDGGDEMEQEDGDGDEMEQEDGDEDEDEMEQEEGDEDEMEQEDGDEDEMEQEDGAEDEMDAEDAIGDGDGDALVRDNVNEVDAEDAIEDGDGDEMERDDVNEVDEEQGNEVDAEQGNEVDAEQGNEVDADQGNEVDAEPEKDVRGPGLN